MPFVSSLNLQELVERPLWDSERLGGGGKMKVLRSDEIYGCIERLIKEAKESVKISSAWLKGEVIEELLKGLDKLKNWPNKVKTMQKNWIGRSLGCEIDFEILGSDQIKKISCFSTRPDTLCGLSFLAISVDHPVSKLYENNKDKIFTINFKNSIFRDGTWDSFSIHARGLFVQEKPQEKIIARGYHKFFNLNEREETTLQNLKKNLKFPVYAIEKHNGFLGLLSVYKNSENKLEWFISTKFKLNIHYLWHLKMDMKN